LDYVRQASEPAKNLEQQIQSRLDFSSLFLSSHISSSPELLLESALAMQIASLLAFSP